MRKGTIYSLLIALCSIAISCELIKLIDKTGNEYIKLTTKTSIGTVAIFSKEISENNVSGASKLFLNKVNYPTDFEAINFQDELTRLCKIIQNKPITYYKIDTLSPNLHNILVEYDYTKEFKYLMEKIDDDWYIISLNFLNNN